MEILARIAEHLMAGDDETVAELTREAVAQNLPPKQILDDGLIAGMNEVGARFKAHEIFLPEVLLAARAMYGGMDELKPLLIRDGIPSMGKVVIGSVQGDMHLGGTQPSGYCGSIQGGDPPADNCHPVSSLNRFAQVDLAQESGRGEHSLGIFTGNAEGMVSGRNPSGEANCVVTFT